MRLLSVFVNCFFTISICNGQSDFENFLKPSDTLHQKSKKALIITEAALTGSAIIGLNALWYSDYPRSNFHTINDLNEWQQMDKVGHMFSSYQLSRLGYETMKWTGAEEKDQYLNSLVVGMSLLTTVEILDGFSSEWGFSWSDMAANTLGTGLFIGQQKLWNEQRLLLKYSFHTTKYAELRPEKLGENLLQEIFKDYNGQTYWMSANINSFIKSKSIPNWLNIAFGYGAEGMLTGDKSDLNYPNQDRIRSYYLSLDVDLTRIKTNSNVLKSVFSVINFVKIPLPTFEINSEKKGVFHLLFF